MVGAAVLLWGCMAGPQPETLVDDLVVVSLVSDPPEAGPGDTVGMDVHLGVPNDKAVDFLLWTCLPIGEDACLEKDAEQRYFFVESAEDALQFEQTVPFETAGLLAAFGEEVPVFVWAMACEQGLCPLLEQAKAGSIDESDLVNPIESLKTLPFDGVSLAWRTLWLSDRPVEERRKNPVLTPDFELPEMVGAGESVTLTFLVDDVGEEAEAFGYSLSGGFGAVETRVFNGAVELTWFAPEELEESGESTLWVVVQDPAGGSALWTGSLNLEKG